jgi:hypothetical protein
MSSKPPEPRFWFRVALLVACTVLSQTGWSMGLRSFVALPVEKGGKVLRLQLERNRDTGRETAAASLAYGLSGRQTLLVGVPYRISPGGADRWGNVSALYRHIVRQIDGPGRTRRLGLLGGAVLATDSGRDPALQAGAVASFHRGRTSWDLDALYQPGLGSRPDGARYDVSWQYRVTPAEYPDWGLATEWDIVLELNGRYIEGHSTVHQATAGLQWIHRRWVLEGGVTRDLSGPRDTAALLSFRWHY